MENANPSCSTSNREFLDPKKKREIKSWLEDSWIVDSLNGSDEIEYFDTLPTLKELEYHEWFLMWVHSHITLPPITSFGRGTRFNNKDSEIRVHGTIVSECWSLRNHSDRWRSQKECTTPVTSNLNNGPQMRYFSYGRHLEDLHVAWAHLEKKRTRLRTNTKTLEDLCSQILETTSQAIHDAVTTHKVTASQHFETASARTDSHANLEDSTYDGFTTKMRRRGVDPLYIGGSTNRFLAHFFQPDGPQNYANEDPDVPTTSWRISIEAWTRFKDLLQKVPHHGIDLWLQVQICYDHVNPITRRTINQSAGGKLRDLNPKESWAILEDLALYDNESWNDPRDFAKPVKAIALPQDVPSTSDKQSNRAWKIKFQWLDGSSSLLRHNLPNDTVKNLKLSTTPVLSARSYPTMNPQCSAQIHGLNNAMTIHPKQPEESQVNEPDIEQEEGNPENTKSNPHPQPDPFASIAIEQVRKLNLMLESLGLVPQSSNTKFVCSKEDSGEVMFIEIIRDDDKPQNEGPMMVKGQQRKDR
ncbi:hypothetical protein Tco_0718439 [Tanacetum coccineum]